MTTAANQLELLVQGNTAFALDLYHAFKKTCPGNLFFYPFSVSSCLAMSLMGARGDTATQIARGIHFDAQDSDTYDRLAALLETLLRDGSKANLELRIANKLWTDARLRVLAQFVDDLNGYYRGGCEKVDFSDSAKVCQLINDWVNEATNTMIPRLVTEGQISGARMVLANAIYFHGKWSVPFEKVATEPRPFSLSPKEQIQVPMMYQWAAGWYAELPNLQILEKWYSEGEFSMVILLPDRADGLEGLEVTLNSESLDRWLSMLTEEEEIQIQMPRFRIESQPPLKLALIEMGMTDVFNSRRADFSGITG